jgi:hypothetical protein
VPSVERVKLSFPLNETRVNAPFRKIRMWFSGLSIIKNQLAVLID